MRKMLLLTVTALTALNMFSFTAYAEDEHELPFELTVPENVAIAYLNGDDSANTCKVAWSQNDSMSEWMSRCDDPESYEGTRKELEQMGYDDLWITPQMDWSIDSKDDWHYNQYWDTEGYDENYVQHLGEWAYIGFLHYPTKNNDAWVFRYMGNIDDPDDITWYGSSEAPGWKDVLKEDQYEIIKGDDESYAKIDFTKHTIYIRMRYLVTARTAENDIKIASDWSDTASVGKDSETQPEITASELKAPVIKDLYVTDEDFNGFPVISFKNEIPPELTGFQTKITADNSGIIRISAEARVADNGEWVELQGDSELKSGELKYALQNLAEAEKSISADTTIELRARYCFMPADGEDTLSPYSDILTFASPDMQISENEVSSDEVSEDDSVEAVSEEKPGKKKGSLLCIFISLVIFIAVASSLFVLMKLKKRSNK
ncbi:MAG: hypothetical protein K5979_14125 [Ruminococcus sp.]|nr:hypothetical protein [Ruminococcus sp.]